MRLLIEIEGGVIQELIADEPVEVCILDRDACSEDNTCSGDEMKIEVREADVSPATVDSVYVGFSINKE